MSTIIKRYAAKYGAPWKLLEAVIWQESNHNASATGAAGEVGLMQIMQPALIEYNISHKTKYILSDLYDSDLNIAVGSWYLFLRVVKMLRYYNMPVTLRTIIWSYNAGIGNAKKGIMPAITAEYINRVSSRSGIRPDADPFKNSVSGGIMAVGLALMAGLSWLWFN